MEKLVIKSADEKISQLYDPVLVETTRKSWEEHAINRINAFMDPKSTEKEIYFTVYSKTNHMRPYKSFFEAIERLLVPYGYICFFSFGGFNIKLPASKAPQPPLSPTSRLELKIVEPAIEV